jgi:hypothetical protein
VEENPETFQSDNGVFETFIKRLTTGVGHFYIEFLIFIFIFYLARGVVGKILAIIWRIIRKFLVKVPLINRCIKSQDEVDADKKKYLDELAE